MENGHWDGFIALLISITPNLQELHITGWDQYDAKYPFLATVLERAAELQKRSILSARSLSNLKVVALAYWDTEDGMGMDFDPFLNLQSLTTLDCCKIEVEDGSPPNPASWITGFGTRSAGYNLRSLDFHSSNIGPHSFIEILRWFPGLENLSYIHTGYTEFAPPAIMAGLKHLKLSLKKLTLFYCGESSLGGNFYNFPIGSLVPFQKLRNLDLSQSMLIGSDDAGSEYDESGIFKSTQDLVTSLPLNLEHLSIKDYDRRIVEPIFELIEKKDLHTPALKVLDLAWTRIIFPDKDSEVVLQQPRFTEEEVLKLLAETKAAGVEVVLKGIPPPEKTAKLFIDGKKLELRFPYPYKGYDKWCEHYGCDLETGEPASFNVKVWEQTLRWRGDFSEILPPNASGLLGPCSYSI